MHKLFGRFRKKNEKILKRELMFAHSCIVLLSLALIAVMSTVYSSLSGVSQVLIIIVNTLLAVVAILSIAIVTYIAKYR